MKIVNNKRRLKLVDLIINPKLKPLYANLLRLGIGRYLISDNFELLCIENNIEDLWKKCKRYIIDRSTGIILNPEYTGYAEEALGLFLSWLNTTGKENFIKILGEILIDFAEWSTEKKDFSKIKKVLLELGYTENDINEIFAEIERKLIDKHASEKLKSNVKTNEIDEKLCFVLMPFDKKFDPIYDVIKECS